jgi:hypothetical protein
MDLIVIDHITASQPLVVHAELEEHLNELPLGRFALSLIFP